ncbi:MAG: AbrB/MazE/SpoVT family DNA-binding domain-containing protein [Armatimonadetes bacterium]|nr:AbrB/MazE/SpoVT family DNA-binding domain-containing protein [Armatimonadota bacterium]
MHGARYWGSATVGERGQMVIPADARKALGIEAGDKMVIFGHDHGKRLVVVKAEVVTEHLTRALGDLTALEAQLREELGSAERGDGSEDTS